MTQDKVTPINAGPNLHVKKTEAVLTNILLRIEHHGDETAKASTLTLKFLAPSKSFEALFLEDAKLLDKIWATDGMPLLGAWELSHRFKIEGIRAKIGKFSFDDCVIKKGLKVRPSVNRTLDVTLKLNFHPGPQKCADALWGFRGEKVKIELLQVQNSLALVPNATVEGG